MVQIVEHAIDESTWSDDERAELLPLTFLTLSRARDELRVPPGDTGQDELIRNQVKSVTSFLIENLQIPILQESVYTVLIQGDQKRPLTFPLVRGLAPGDPFVLRCNKISYQDQGVEIYTRGDWPLDIEIDDDHQIAPGVDPGDKIAGNIIIKPPDGAWPLAAQRTYAVFYQRGIKVTDSRLDEMRSLAILKLRDLFFGVGFMKGTEQNTAYERLAKSIRYRAATHDFHRIT